jgi:hypothetical protein
MGVIEAASERLIAAGAASWRMCVPWIEIVDVLLSPRLEICMECRWVRTVVVELITERLWNSKSQVLFVVDVPWIEDASNTMSELWLGWGCGSTLVEEEEDDWVVGLGKEEVVMDGGQAFW